MCVSDIKEFYGRYVGIVATLYYLRSFPRLFGFLIPVRVYCSIRITRNDDRLKKTGAGRVGLTVLQFTLNPARYFGLIHPWVELAVEPIRRDPDYWTILRLVAGNSISPHSAPTGTMFHLCGDRTMVRITGSIPTRLNTTSPLPSFNSDLSSYLMLSISPRMYWPDKPLHGVYSTFAVEDPCSPRTATAPLIANCGLEINRWIPDLFCLEVRAPLRQSTGRERSVETGDASALPSRKQSNFASLKTASASPPACADRGSLSFKLSLTD